MIKKWHTWLLAEGILAFVCLFNIYGMRVSRARPCGDVLGVGLQALLLQIMAIVDKVSLYFFFFTFICYLVVPIACANPTLQPPSFVFGTFINETGYSPFVAFMVGLVGVTTAFGGNCIISTTTVGR